MYNKTMIKLNNEIEINKNIISLYKNLYKIKKRIKNIKNKKWGKELYKIEYKDQNNKYFKEFENLKDIFQPKPLKNIEENKLSKVYDKFNYGLNILKPTEKEDYQIIYSNKQFWDYFTPNLHEKIKGTLINQLIPGIKNLDKILLQENNKSEIKLYENNKIIKKWNLEKIKEKNLIYINIQDKTPENTLKDLSKLSQNYNQISDEKILQILNKYLPEITTEYTTVFNVKDNNGYYWTNEIYNLLEIKTEKKPTFTKENLIFQHTTQDNINKINKTIEQIRKNILKTVEYPITTENGEKKYLKSYFKLIEENNQKYIITITKDRTEEYHAKKETLTLKEDMNIIEDYCNIFMWHYENGEMEFTPQIYNIIGVSPEEYSPRDLFQFTIKEDEKKFMKCFNNLSAENPTYNLIYRLKNIKGEIRYIDTYNYATFNEKGEMIKVVAFQQDVTEKVLMEREALRLTENFSLIQDSSKIGICEFKENHYSFTSEVYKILGINKNNYPDTVDILREYIVEEDIEIWKKALHLTVEKPVLSVTYRIKRPDGQIRHVYMVNKGIFNENDGIIRVISFVQDVTDTIEREIKLEQLLEDRKILLQEVHHRVKNNLQLILSFVNIETRYNKDNPEYVIKQIQNRIKNMALTHEEVYKSPTVSHVNLETFFKASLDNLFNQYTGGNIKIHYDLEPVQVHIDKSIPLGLLVNELALNTIKYAFPETGKGDFYISIKEINGNVIMKVYDNGVGLPEGTDLFTSSGLGFTIIRNLTQQLEAEIEILDEISSFGVKLKIPLK
jgi:two-component sensor histidine kinase/PAS domain-containing protein